MASISLLPSIYVMMDGFCYYNSLLPFLTPPRLLLQVIETDFIRDLRTSRLSWNQSCWIGECTVDWVVLGIYNEMDLIEGEFDVRVFLISHRRCCLAGVSFPLRPLLVPTVIMLRQGRPQLKLYRDYLSATGTVDDYACCALVGH